MEDVFEAAADRSGVPEELRGEVIDHVREVEGSRVVSELAEAMHYSVVMRAEDRVC